jgi:hypothetical protein
VTHFEEALLDKLKAHTLVPAGAAGRTRVRAPRTLVAAGALTAAAAITAAIVVNPFTAAPAYAVTRNPDGSVSITWKDLAKPAAATRDLRRAGLPAKVIKLSRPGGCPAPAGSGAPWAPPLKPAAGDLMVVFFGSGPGRFAGADGWIDGEHTTENMVSFIPSAIPKGATVLIVQDKTANGTIIVGAGLVDSPVPTCWERAG